jgi:cell division protein FtsI/penicillin-binding protein 2
MDRRALVAGVTAGVLVLGGAGGGLWWRHQQAEQEADRAAAATLTRFAAAWGTRSFAATRFAGVEPTSVQEGFRTATAGLGSGPVAVRAEDVRRTGDRATATLSVTWTLAGGATWAYDVPATATQEDGAWAVRLPADPAQQWHPALRGDDRLAAERTWGERGDLLDRDGEPLMPVGTVYPVQIDPARASVATVRSLAALVDEPAADLVARLEAAQKSGSKAPIPVITYREADFEQRRAALDALNGVIYPARQQPLARTRTFGQPLLGSYGPVSAEQVTRSKGRYVAGDFAGVSGLQGQYDAVLGGTAGVQVVSSGRPDTPLFSQAAKAGADVRTPLDPEEQEAAEGALVSTGDVPSALVAVDVRTGGVLASANSPAFGFDRAVTGQYPPGSAFKVVTTYALLTGRKVTPTTTVTCPRTTVVDGRSYKNYEGESLGSPDFATDFAHSCNTAFVQLAAELGDDELRRAAATLGLGTGWGKSLGAGGAFDGSVPENNGATDKASASIGQGRNLASPLAMAALVANVARGATVPPALVTEPAPEGSDRSPSPLDAGAVDQLRDLMRQVVTDGTAQVLQGTPGGAVAGKTGTAEFGTRTPPETHAWFVGYQGDVAFAVLVEKGRSGGTVAAPVAKRFLAALAGR